MSDNSKTLNVSSLISKKTRRAKERLLQNFGKADRTTDELFEAHQISFNKQQSVALNLQKQVKNYLHCLKELHQASKSLNNCLLEMHEKEWPKHDAFENNSYEAEQINEDLEDRLKESVLVPLEQYLGQFTEMREKISKRGRKLVDYDSQRHSFETLQQNQVGKQLDDMKLAEHREQLEQARNVYETLNKELHEELPELYDNRIPFVATIFQRLFSSHITYHSDSIVVQKSYLETVECLAKALERNSLSSVKPITDHQVPSTTTTTTVTSQNNPELDPENPFNEATEESAQVNGDQSSVEKTDPVGPPKPPVFLHKVKTTYKYMAEDEDELSFEAGEVIQVIEYDDPAEQEEGWLMGIKESDGQKGLFPANFTKEIKS
uniref:Myc box-dependent-interacting protein 1 n=1 Tax=Aceria tosichella TaxID=561515 RepID=A0A6G1SJW4_9ACAR